MGKIFNYDNAVFRFIGKIVDAFYISVLWIVFCLPIVTAGASTSALYYTVHKSLKGDRGYVWESFWGEFRNHLKDSIIIAVVYELLFVLVTIDKYLMGEWMQAGTEQASMFGILYYVFFTLQFFLAVLFVETFCYRARFEIDRKSSVRNAIKISLAYLPSSVLAVLILVAAVIAIYLLPFIVIFIPAIVALLLDFIFERIYRKLMTAEEREAEEELDAGRKAK